MSAPIYVCLSCKRIVPVVQDGPGFPPDQAKRRLKARCEAAGHESEPKYRAGIAPELDRLLRSPGDTE